MRIIWTNFITLQLLSVLHYPCLEELILSSVFCCTEWKKRNSFSSWFIYMLSLFIVNLASRILSHTLIFQAPISLLFNLSLAFGFLLSFPVLSGYLRIFLFNFCTANSSSLNCHHNSMNQDTGPLARIQDL